MPRGGEQRHTNASDGLRRDKTQCRCGPHGSEHPQGKVIPVALLRLTGNVKETEADENECADGSRCYPDQNCPQVDAAFRVSAKNPVRPD